MLARIKPVLRLALNGLLETSTARRGIAVTINGEHYRVTPACRRMFPTDYEKSVQKCVRDHVREGMTVLDIGAHIGIHSLLLARLVGPSGLVVAIEPVPCAAKVLSRHAQINGFSNRFRVLECAIGTSDGLASLWVARYGIDPGNGALPNPEKDGRIVQVPRTTIDRICRDFNISPGFIKIDIEGGELDALRGAAGVLSGPTAPVIVCALHPWHLQQLGQSERDVFQFAGELGLRVFDLDGSPSGPTGLGREVIFHP